MSTTRYLEITSTYRDRNRWPLPGEFEIPISQTGRKGRYDALDPVSNAAPIKDWTSNNFNVGTPGRVLTVTVATATNPDPLAGTNDGAVFIINAGAGVNLQQIEDYYINAIANNTTIGESRRIVDYKYLGLTSGGLQKAQITVDSAFGSTFASGNTIQIADPTDLSDTSYPEFFVPAGRLGEDAYANLILYNETRNQYRPTLSYNMFTHLLIVDTSGSTVSTASSGPVTTWTVTDNYSLRQDPPSFFGAILAGSTANTLNFPATASTIDNYYTRQFVLFTSGTNANESRIISAYNGTTQVANVYPGFTSAPVAGDTFEILDFSYDNLFPFVYTGSTVSQQEDVCYEIELLDLILPNDTLTVAQGNRIAFYPYVYCELTNISTSSSGNRDIIYSNNPNAQKMLFRCTINDTSNPLIATFIKIDGDGARQTIKFRPNTNLLFSVKMPNGDVYNTVMTEQYSPLPPKAEKQISALFSLRRISSAGSNN